jgi:1-deoxy-D-xylulose-5-phosphate synthase
MRVLAPSSAQELAQMLHDAISLADAGPVAIRYPRGAARQVSEHEVGSGLAARKVVTGAGTCIVAVGKMLETAERAAQELAGHGIEVTVWDARCCAPLDPDMIADAARHDRVITIEDGVRDGGIGMAIADAVSAIDQSTHVEVLGLPTKFIPHDPKSEAILARFGLDSDSIVALVRTA